MNRDGAKLLKRYIIDGKKDYMFMASMYSLDYYKAGWMLTYAEVEEVSEDDIPFT
jgi:hypothetical protein